MPDGELTERNATEARSARSERLLTARFVLVVSSGLCYFTALAMLTPVLPLYVEKSLGQGSVAVGVAVGAFAVGAIALRTYAGWLGDSLGRRILIIGGAFIVGVSVGVLRPRARAVVPDLAARGHRVR